MTTAGVDRWLLAAAVLDPPARGALLDRLESTDPVAARTVRRRLAAAADLPDDFLTPPDTGFVCAAFGDGEGESPCALDPPLGDDRYEIGERLGVGGMARVYRAFDRRLGRPVALKIFPATDRESPQRLLAEARAQARVRHDHVLDVYETGELDGLPYIAVPWAAGGTLADLAPSVGLEARVRLIAQAAEGLHAAHRQGLLHGDVKPANILVEESPDGDLAARVGDFGIATELDGHRDAGILAGTPRFMAPEILDSVGRRQRRQRRDRRADVYGLGVTLAQVLTDRGDGDGAGAGDLPPDLAAVIERATARDPDERYPSARALGDDLGRFLDGEVVEAYADRRAYRWSRWAARHRRLLAVAGVAAVLLAAALAVAAMAGVRAVAAHARAEARQAQAEDLVGFMLLDLRDRLEGVGRLDLLDQVGERAMAYFAAVPEAELSDDELARRATALHQIGDVRLRQGDLAGAERPLAESLALARHLVERSPDDPDRLYDLGQSEFWSGYALWERGETAAARRHFASYHELSRRLVERDPANLAWQTELAYAESNLASVAEREGDLQGALERYRAVLAIDRRLVAAARRRGDAEAVDHHRFELAATHTDLGAVLERLGRPDDARDHYAANLALRQGLAEDHPEDRTAREFLGTGHQYLGHLGLEQDDLAAARHHLDQAGELFAQLTAHDPANTDWRYKRSLTLWSLGRLERAAGDPASAEGYFRAAHTIARELAAAAPDRLDWRRHADSTRRWRALLAAG